LACLGAALAAAPALAATDVALSGRTSVNYFYYFGGFAIDGDEGEDGAPLPPAGAPWEGVTVTALAPSSLAIQGSDYEELNYMFWSGYLAEEWNQAQNYTFGNGMAGAELHIEGYATSSQTSIVCSDITGCGLASEVHRSTNTQTLEFTLSAGNAYELSGLTSGGQWVELAQWSDLAHRWIPLVFGAIETIDTSFELSGVLAAGRYRLTNNPYTFSGGGATDVVNAWNATLALPGAVAVPEPAPASLWLAGALLLCGLHRRRRT
jgi:hypothetical protein